MWAIGDEAISRRSPYKLGLTGLAQDDDPIAMNLPQCHKITGTDANRPTESVTIAVHARRVIAASKTQVQ